MQLIFFWLLFTQKCHESHSTPTYIGSASTVAYKGSYFNHSPVSAVLTLMFGEWQTEFRMKDFWKRLQSILILALCRVNSAFKNVFIVFDIVCYVGTLWPTWEWHVDPELLLGSLPDAGDPPSFWLPTEEESEQLLWTEGKCVVRQVFKG